MTQEARSLRCQLLEHGRARVEVTRQRPHSGLSHRSPEDTTGGHPAPVDTTDTLEPSLPGWSHRKQTEDMRTLCPCVPQPRARTHQDVQRTHGAVIPKPCPRGLFWELAPAHITHNCGEQL